MQKSYFWTNAGLKFNISRFVSHRHNWNKKRWTVRQWLSAVNDVNSSSRIDLTFNRISILIISQPNWLYVKYYDSWIFLPLNLSPDWINDTLQVFFFRGPQIIFSPFVGEGGNLKNTLSISIYKPIYLIRLPTSIKGNIERTAERIFQSMISLLLIQDKDTYTTQNTRTWI